MKPAESYERGGGGLVRTRGIWRDAAFEGGVAGPAGFGGNDVELPVSRTLRPGVAAIRGAGPGAGPVRADRAEREIRQKSAGLRTYTLVGLASALIMLVSKYGFTDMLVQGRVVLDPSRMAAQIVSGIGFIGGGVIFVRKDLVRGLTTATTIWVTAAVGMACGGGLPLLAVAVTAANFVVVFASGRSNGSCRNRAGRPRRYASSTRTGGASCARFSSSAPMRNSPSPASRSSAAAASTGAASTPARPAQRRPPTPPRGPWRKAAHSVPASKPAVTVALELRGGRSIARLVDKLSEIDGVFAVNPGDAGLIGD